MELDAEKNTVVASEGNQCPAPGCSLEGCICPSIVALDTEILKMQKILVELSKQRDGLKRRLNYYHKPFINRLPVELISKLFIDIVNEAPSEIIYNFKTPLHLGSVCQLWRNITLATPRLWTSLNIQVKSHGHPYSNIDVAKEWLLRSHSLPLSLRINFPDAACAAPCTTSSFDSKPDEMINALRFHSTRWGCMDLHGRCPHCLHQLLDALQDSPPADLEFLSIEEFKAGSGTFDVGHVLLPQSISQSGPRYGCVGLWDLPCGFERLTRMVMYTVPIGEVFYFIRNAPNLVECIAHLSEGTPIDEDDGFPLPTSPVVAEHLDHLTTCFSSSSEFFDCLTLPSLRTLEHEYYIISGDSDFDSLVSCLNRSAPPLQEFNLTITFISSHSVIDWNNFFPSVTSLTVDISDLCGPKIRGLCRITESILAALARRSGPLALPKLQSLWLFTQGMSQASWAYLCDIFQDQSSERSVPHRLLKKIEIRLTNKTWERDFDMERKVFDRFEDLKKYGVELTVIQPFGQQKFGNSVASWCVY